MTDWTAVKTHETLYLRKWRDGEKEAGLPPYEVIAYREVRDADNQILEQWQEVITHPADIALIEGHVAEQGVDVFSGRNA
jgi:hypothetical protein